MLCDRDAAGVPNSAVNKPRTAASISFFPNNGEGLGSSPLD